MPQWHGGDKSHSTQEEEGGGGEGGRGKKRSPTPCYTLLHPACYWCPSSGKYIVSTFLISLWWLAYEGFSGWALTLKLLTPKFMPRPQTRLWYQFALMTFFTNLAQLQMQPQYLLASTQFLWILQIQTIFNWNWTELELPQEGRRATGTAQFCFPS